MNTKYHVLYALRNAVVKTFPFPHFYVKEVFPAGVYNDLLKYVDKLEDYKTLMDQYPARSFGPEGIPPGLEFMAEDEFMHEVMMIFLPWYKKRFGDKNTKVSTDLRLVRDKIGYQIGPHTDAPWKLVSLLFYLPQLWCYHDAGTGIYIPNDRRFKCVGGPHYDFDGFHEAWRAPYVPNSCFGFWKTANSFHGVEPITRDFRRDVMLYNIYDTEKIPNRGMIPGESSVETGHVDVRSEGS